MASEKITGTMKNLGPTPSRRVVAAKESEVLSFIDTSIPQAQNYLFDAEEFEEEEYEFEGEDYEEFAGRMGRTETVVFKEKESIEKLCKSIANYFMDSAWSICAERFYFSTAPLAVSLELRDTWLRIIEAEWLDHDKPQIEFTADHFQPGEPPPPLVMESRSTELFMNSRALPKKLLADNSISESVQQEVKKKKKKGKSKTKDKGGKSKKKIKSKTKVKGAKSKKKIKSKSKSKKTAKSGKSKSRVGGKKNKGKSKLKKPKVPVADTEEIKDPVVSEEEEEETPMCVPPPPPKVELPWEVLFMNKQLFPPSTDVSPILSEEYKRLGLEPWDPAEHIKNAEILRSSTTKPQTNITNADISLSSKSKNVDMKVSGVKEGQDRESEGSEFKSIDTRTVTASPESTIIIKKTEHLESKENHVVEDEPSPVNVLDRIDNLLVADSDHVVEILRPVEAERGIAPSIVAMNPADLREIAKVKSEMKRKSTMRKSLYTPPRVNNKNADKSQKGPQQSVKPTQAPKTAGLSGNKGNKTGNDNSKAPAKTR